MNSTKACSLCSETKDISLYHKGRNQCKECYKSKRKCIHGKTKAECRECEGSAFCSHNNFKTIFNDIRN